ncbi:uncharacterized protein CTHT_0019010 [Thermochaetoides thermophila DSM 1495]|uniref:Uncharacterized protein n=1 Tax=Chaetomium thermophilum (strain DSM 1495 / CBS 144.50 / IMI 039719) TaxID=759272 RepID=G0S2Z1_CHATD|nr:hypothetical protein CTHT_0019010 [Thermochaetoides thermophila DSM 1495]EGS22374.1 hypothetical protein CTHT_0019010 [Thermochaetoides thermophila DSM 1495]
MLTLSQLAALGLAVSSLCSATPEAAGQSLIANSTIVPSEAAARKNAFAIFNSLHSALRQWGSSLNHNGMSLFLVIIPPGVVLHHGTHSPIPPKGPEWLAFEIEHAEQFARARHKFPPPSSPGSEPGGRPGVSPGPPPFPNAKDEQHPFPFPPAISSKDHLPHPKPWTKVGGEEESHGYLHTYRTIAPLPLLYLDGTSAGNTPQGTLDTQDFLLRLNRTADIMDEWGRARELCDLVTAWGLSGVIRMEAGFEVILCDFKDPAIKFDGARQRPDAKFERPPGPPGSGRQDEGEQVRIFEYMRAVARRYDGIGSGRANIDWRAVVSALWYDVDVVWERGMPRLSGLTDEQLKGLRSRIEELVRKRGSGAETESGIDWQAVVDMIVARYAERLQVMVQDESLLQLIRVEVSSLLDTYIDYGEKDEGFSAAMARCAKMYTSPLTLTTLEDHAILAAVETVTFAICTALFDVRKLVVENEDADEAAVEKAKQVVKNLMQKLGWTTFKKCTPGCGYGEVCFIPMWPFGDRDSYKKPNCRNATTITRGWWENSYWDWMFPRKPPSDGEGSRKGLERGNAGNL